MREYLYNVRMAFKNHGLIKSLELTAELTKLHVKKLLIKGSAKKHDRLLGFRVNFFDYAALTGLFEEIFIQKQYYFKAKTDSPVIIDCGSNIGMSVLYFKKLYPRCRITAFEPDAAAFEMLKKNVMENSLKGITLVNAAAAGSRGRVKFFSDKNKPGNLHMSLLKNRVENGRAVYVEKTALSGYVKGRIDFLKMDVEGAEAEIIRELDRSKKLSRINLMAVEIHHNIGGGPDILNTVTGILGKNSMKYNISCRYQPPFTGARFQDMLLYAETKNNKRRRNK